MWCSEKSFGIEVILFLVSFFVVLGFSVFVCIGRVIIVSVL